MDRIFEGILWYLAFLFSTTLHEASHAFAALRLGDSTAYLGGHVTLDPRPHIRREPVGTVIVPIASYFLGGWMMGWASIPYNPEWSLQYPRRSALMSLAGPLANLALLVFSAVMIRAGMIFNVFTPPEAITFTHITAATSNGFLSGVSTFVSILFSLNLLLFLFNLLPVPPLDGSGIIPLLLTVNQSRKYLLFIRNASFSFIGLFVAWNLFQYVYHPIHLLCINLLYPELHYK